MGSLSTPLERRHLVGIAAVLILIGGIYYAVRQIRGVVTTTAAGVDHAFKKFDSDSDGGINEDEIRKFHAALDGNGDGKVTKGELAAYARKLRSEMAPPPVAPATAKAPAGK